MIAAHEDVRPRTVAESVLQKLREDISSGALAPGTRLRQMDVAKRFGVSSTPVREAFAALESEGLVVSSTHRGVVVFQPTLDDLREIYEIRIALEVLAIRAAVPKMTARDHAEIKAILDEMGSLGSSDADKMHYTQLNRQFHARLYEPAQMPKLERMILDLRDASAAYINLHSSIAPLSSETQRDHTLIYEACSDGDVDRAGEALGAHLRHSVEAVTQTLESRGDDPATVS
ncbi:MAG: GntR family transcriptional regulator [Acidimicrobiales bacterium]